MTLNDLQWPLTASIDLNVSLFGKIIQIRTKRGTTVGIFPNPNF